MSSKIDVGDRVVCIIDTIKVEAISEVVKDFKTFVVKDREYTIREFLENDGIVIGVLLNEISNPKRYFKLLRRYQEPAFGLFRFRKLSSALVDEEHEEHEESDVLVLIESN